MADGRAASSGELGGLAAPTCHLACARAEGPGLQPLLTAGPALSQTRQLVKDGFLVELSEGSRKLRHVFLFTDVVLCAKLKKTAVG